MRVLLIDNYDSFTHNLYQQICAQGAEVDVYRNDQISLDQALSSCFTHYIISPGPGRPENLADFGICSSLIHALVCSPRPLLGVCLGHQGIAHYFGAKIVHAPEVMHGKTSIIEHHGTHLFDQLPSSIPVMRYHSLVVDSQDLPDCLQVNAWCGSLIMGIQHCHLPFSGVQFHPESIGTEFGDQMISNFLRSNDFKN